MTKVSFTESLLGFPDYTGTEYRAISAQEPSTTEDTEDTEEFQMPPCPLRPLW